MLNEDVNGCENGQSVAVPKVTFAMVHDTQYRNLRGSLITDPTPCVEIMVSGLPKAARHDVRTLGESQLIKIVHQYKHLLTDGDVAGRQEYERKRTAQFPLQNRFLRLPLTYTFCYMSEPSAETSCLKITLMYNTAAPAVVRSGAEWSGQDWSFNDNKNETSADELSMRSPVINNDDVSRKCGIDHELRGDRILSLQEVQKCLQVFGAACSEDLRIFLESRSNTTDGVPDYFGLSD